MSDSIVETMVSVSDFIVETMASVSDSIVDTMASVSDSITLEDETTEDEEVATEDAEYLIQYLGFQPSYLVNGSKYFG